MLFLCTFLFASTLSILPLEDYTETPDLWSCGVQDWGPNEARLYPVTDDAPVGKYALALNYNYGYEHYAVLPKWRNAGWDLRATDYVEFRVKVAADTQWRGPNPTLYLRSNDGSFVRIRPSDRRSLLVDAAGKGWQTIRVPLAESPEWERVVWLGGSLRRVDFVELAFVGGGPGGAAHSVLIDGVRFGPAMLPYTPPNEQAGDLDVLIIERTPRYERYQVTDYRPTKEDPNVEVGHAVNKGRKHYPDNGEPVTFTARVQNKGQQALGGSYQWLLDGRPVASGKLQRMEPRKTTHYTWKWRWDPADHDITFRLQPDGEDYCPRNNELTIRNNALMLKFMIERGLIARMESKVNMTGSYSCEDWLQGQIRFMNQLFENSVYEFAPKGIEQRVAVGLFEYVEDGYLPTLGAGPYKVGELDISCDGGRGCTALDDPWKSGAGAPAFLNFIGRPDDAWLHELSHQIGVIDDYQFITEPEDNLVNGVGFTYRNRGLMGGGEISPHPYLGTLYSLYSPSNVHGLNATKGKRRGYFGEYLYQIPKQCSLRLLEEDGKPVADAEIKVYQTSQRKIDTIPEHEGRTDARGLFPLANRPAGPHTTETGCTLSDNPFGPIHVVGFNGVFLVTVKQGDRELYGFTSVPEFNIEYAKGNRERAVIPVYVKRKGEERHYYGRR
ncbi:MAG: hypothetical protein AMXMBFR61_08240 [Fimbriimonadales bacterium]